MKEFLYERAEQRLIEKELNPQRSTRLAQWSGADHTGSLMSDTETLFVSERGEYFIIYEGGMGSGFHSLPGVESWFGGSYIRTVSIEDAYAWCEETGNTDTIRDHFPFFLLSVSR